MGMQGSRPRGRRAPAAIHSFPLAPGVPLRLAFAAPLPPDAPRPPFYQRGTSLVGAIMVTLLIILAMWSINVRTPQKPRFKGTLVLDLKSDEDKADTSAKQVQTNVQPREAQPRPNTPTPPTPVPPPPRPSPLPVVHPYYIPLTKDENDSADIGRLPHAGLRSGAQEASTGGPGDSKPIGNAPDGSPLYKAEWYREPTDAELGFYLPKNQHLSGVGIIACKTIDHHHVDDCIELGSFPPGSHFASAVRQAAWQFLVRAPRRGGKELVGTWVAIKITYHSHPEDEDKSEDTPKQPADSTYIPY